MTLRESFASHIILPIADRIRGTTIQKKTRFLKESQWWTREKLEQYQNEKLRLLVEHAYQNVPYYRRIFKQENLTPSEIKTPQDLTKIPILQKNHVRKFRDELIASNIDASNRRAGRTGGSTGEPLQFYNDKNTLSWVWGSMNRYYQWTGMRPGEGRFDVGGGSLGGFLSKGRAKDFLSKGLRWFQNYTFYPSFQLDDVMARDIAISSRKKGIRTIRGYPSGLYLLAKYAKDEGLDFEHIKIIQSTS
ncbi:MAG: hypothetical protein ACXAEF_08700, partial [Candidatus Thorarchaeota archaeon]